MLARLRSLRGFGITPKPKPRVAITIWPFGWLMIFPTERTKP